MAENEGGEPQELTLEAAAAKLGELFADSEAQTPPNQAPKKEEATPGAEPAPAPAPEPPDEPAADETKPSNEEPPAGADEPAAPELVPFKIGDEEIKVPAKVREELEKGTLRQADYTRKTQATAEKAKELAAREAEIESERTRLVKALEAAEKVVKGEMPKEPDWNALRQQLDPVDFAAAVADHQVAVRNFEKLQELRKTEQAKADEVAARKFQVHLEGEQQKVLDAIPEWKDEAKRKADQKEMTEYAVARLGRTEAEVRNIADASLVILLRKAMLYDKAQAAVGKPAPKGAGAASPATTIVPARPGAKPPAPPSEREKELAKAHSSLKKSGSVTDAGRALARLIDL
jgi:hypothetical protein